MHQKDRIFDRMHGQIKRDASFSKQVSSTLALRSPSAQTATSCNDGWTDGQLDTLVSLVDSSHGRERSHFPALPRLPFFHLAKILSL